MVKIVCMCKQLVDVVDRVISDHLDEDGEEPCPASGMRHISHKSAKAFPGQPTIEVVAVGPVECDNCGNIEVAALVKVDAPDPRNN